MSCTSQFYRFDGILYHCWEQQPEDRPTFSELVYSVSAALEGIAGYMDFSPMGASGGVTEEVEEGQDGQEK